MKNKNQKIAVIIEGVNPTKNPTLTDEQIAALKTTGQIILALAAITAVATVAAIAPNAVKILSRTAWARRKFSGYPPNERKKRINQEITRAFYYVKQSGQVKLIPKGDDHLIDIKEKGRRVLKRINFDNLKVPVQKEWDGRYWVVMADIPVKLRYWARKFAEKVKIMGFCPLQRTIWFFPFDPRDEIDFVSEFFHVYRFVTVARVDKLNESDAKLLEKFFREKGIVK